MTIATGATSQLGQGAYRQPFVHDRWAGLTHVIGTGIGPVFPAPGVHAWMPPDDRRRLVAYQVLQAYVDNVRRHWLPSHMWRPGLPTDGTGAQYPPALQYREYGTAGAVVDATRALVLGDTQRFRVPDAEPAKDPSGKLVTPPPGQLPVETKTYLEKWADSEKLPQKLIENETRVVGLGDGVMVLFWDGDVNRPRLGAYDPGFFFPDWSAIESPDYVKNGWRDKDFPPVAHLAWEWIDPNGTVWIRRTTWRMVRLPRPVRVPYRQEPVAWTCMYDQADYDPGKVADSTVYTFPKGARRTVLADGVDLRVDFLPVVHVTNDYPGSNLWGQSVLTRVSQILDDVASADTDLALNSEVVASPRLVTKGAAAVPETGPGSWDNMFGDGDAKLIDTQHTLDALLKHVEHLRQMLAQNSRLGQMLLGSPGSGTAGHTSSGGPGGGASGYAIRLGFASAEALEREMTLVRKDKYALLGRMVASFASANGLIPAGPLPRIELVLGRGLPADRAAIIQEVSTLLTAHAISTLTAVKMLAEAGFPIDDAVTEVGRIQAEHVEVGIGIVETTGNVAAGAEYLGVKPGPPPPPAQAPAPGPGTPTPAPNAGADGARPAQPAPGGPGPAEGPPPPPRVGQGNQPPGLVPPE